MAKRNAKLESALLGVFPDAKAMPKDVGVGVLRPFNPYFDNKFLPNGYAVDIDFPEYTEVKPEWMMQHRALFKLRNAGGWPFYLVRARDMKDGKETSNYIFVDGFYGVSASPEFSLKEASNNFSELKRKLEIHPGWDDILKLAQSAVLVCPGSQANMVHQDVCLGLI